MYTRKGNKRFDPCWDPLDGSKYWPSPALLGHNLAQKRKICSRSSSKGTADETAVRIKDHIRT